MHLSPRTSTLILAALLGTAACASLSAAERRFAYSYEATGMPRGLWEYEQWVTWKAYGDKDLVDFKHELEYGVTDTLTLSLYLVNWRYEDGDDVASETDYKSSALSLRGTLTDPNESFLGSAWYGEVTVGDEEFALEGKLLLQKNLGPLTAVYNLIVEAEWEGEDLQQLNEKVGVWENTFGLSYQISPHFLVGAEALHELEFADWSQAGKHVVYAGPNLSFRAGTCFATLAALSQISDIQDEADSQLRLIAGFTF
jgi:hypothetical protein